MLPSKLFSPETVSKLLLVAILLLIAAATVAICFYRDVIVVTLSLGLTLLLFAIWLILRINFTSQNRQKLWTKVGQQLITILTTLSSIVLVVGLGLLSFRMQEEEKRNGTRQDLALLCLVELENLRIQICSIGGHLQQVGDTASISTNELIKSDFLDRALISGLMDDTTATLLYQVTAYVQRYNRFKSILEKEKQSGRPDWALVRPIAEKADSECAWILKEYSYLKPRFEDMIGTTPPSLDSLKASVPNDPCFQAAYRLIGK